MVYSIGSIASRELHGRNRRIRTSDPRLPKTVLYQAELCSDVSARRYI